MWTETLSYSQWIQRKEQNGAGCELTDVDVNRRVLSTVTNTLRIL